MLIVLDDGDKSECQQFASVEDLGTVHISPYAMPWEQRRHIYVCRGLKMPVAQFWPPLKYWL